MTWQVRTVYSTGDVPWAEFPRIGTPFDLRGYRFGQYRDGTILFGLVEYRHMFLRRNPDKKGSLKSRHGFVTWVGTGSLAQSYAGMKNWLPNVGVGYRFEVQNRMNARLDFGIGTETTGFYVSFNEAF